MAIGGGGGNPQDGGGLVAGQAREEPQLDQAGLERVQGGQPRQRFVEGQQFLVGRRGGDVVEVEALQAAAAFLGLLAAGLVDADVTHSRRRRREEMAAVVVAAFASVARRSHHAQVGFVQEGRGIERLPGLVPRQLGRRQLAQLVIDERQELAAGVRVARFDSGQDARDLGHAREHTARAHRPQRAGGLGSITTLPQGRGRSALRARRATTELAAVLRRRVYNLPLPP
jgi:hypothetical protein